MLAPHAKQRNAMVDFGGFPEPPAGVRATVALDALEKLPVVATALAMTRRLVLLSAHLYSVGTLYSVHFLVCAPEGP